jgi:predicted phosphoribosyltransferase
MLVYEEQPIFQDRIEAGRRLGERLHQFRGSEVIVFAIPRGGVPVAIEVARRLDSPLDIVVPRKIAIPHNPEAGYGAVTEDGVIVLNEPLTKQLGLTEPQIQGQAEGVREEIRKRSALYRGRPQAPPVRGKTAIIVDDGLASGFTMVAAIRSVERREAASIVVAVPVASGTAYDLIRPLTHELVSLVIARVYQFAVASFYHQWHDLSDEEVIEYLADWDRTHHLGG